jgi:hypothetical protein
MFIAMLAQLEEKYQDIIKFYQIQCMNLEAEIGKCDIEHSNTIPTCIKKETITIDGLSIFHSVNGELVKCTRCNK